MTYTLHHADCLDALRAMPAESVDAIVCDPPYALSDRAHGVGNRILNALAKIGLPQLYDFDSEAAEGGHLSLVSVAGADLGCGDGTLGVEPRVGMPIGAIHLDDDAVGQLKVDERAEPSGDGIPDSDLSAEGNSDAEQFLGDFILDLGDLAVADQREMTRRCKPEAFPGGFAVPVVAAGATGLDCLSRGRLPVVGGHQDVLASNDSPCEPKAASGVAALPGAVNTLMLRFDLRGTPLELCATYRADQFATGDSIASPCPCLVRARSGARHLSATAQAHRVRVVLPTANGTRSTHWLHLWMPREADIAIRLPRGGFMDKGWDAILPDPEIWAEALRVARPGSVLLAFGGTRTYHRLACAIEDAGWTIWDTIADLHNPRLEPFVASLNPDQLQAFLDLIADAGPLAWMHGQGWPKGKAQLKPAWEPIIAARKGAMRALSIAACRIGADSTRRPLGKPLNGAAYGSDRSSRESLNVMGGSDAGRWPANVILDEGAARMLDDQVGELTSGARREGAKRSSTKGNVYSTLSDVAAKRDFASSKGGPSRFFYVAKASTRERELGCEHLRLHENVGTLAGDADGSLKTGSGNERNRTARNHHPTVKPVDLMRYLVRLVTKPGDTVLDPFAGSGTTGVAAIAEGRHAILCEREEPYTHIIRARCDYALRQAGLGL